MSDDRELWKHFRMLLPDVPRWVETRSLLARRDSVVVADSVSEPHYAVVGSGGRQIAVVGCPSASLIQELVNRHEYLEELLAAPETAEFVSAALPDWIGTKAVIHVRDDGPDENPRVEAGLATRLIALGEPEPNALFETWPTEQQVEFRDAAQHSPLSLVIADQQAVSVVYAGSQTETWWDVSVDTLPAYRWRGFAGLAFARLDAYFSVRGKQPVWGALASNLPSLRLASRLGFHAVDELVVFERQSRA